MVEYGPRYKRWIVDAILLIGLLASIFPFYWMIVMATNTTSEIYRVPPKLIFGSYLLTNITHVLQNISFWNNFLNTVCVACTITVLQLFFCSLAGFTFAKFDFPLKNPLFVLLVGTMMLPSAGSLVALFVIMANLGWIGSFLPLIMPSIVTAFGIFWIRQYALGAIPNELIEAGRVDGMDTLVSTGMSQCPPCDQHRATWVSYPSLPPGMTTSGR